MNLLVKTKDNTYLKLLLSFVFLIFVTFYVSYIPYLAKKLGKFITPATTTNTILTISRHTNRYDFLPYQQIQRNNLYYLLGFLL